MLPPSGRVRACADVSLEASAIAALLPARSLPSSLSSPLLLLAADAARRVQTRSRLDIQAPPIASFDNRDASRTRFGALEFRGGLVLTSRHSAFRRNVGLHMEPDGAHFISVTDYGRWLRGRIVYRDGGPAGIADAEMAPILGRTAGRFPRAAGATRIRSREDDGMLYVGIERVEQIVRFDYRRYGLRARGEPIPVPPDFKTFTYNKSLECLAVPPKGRRMPVR